MDTLTFLKKVLPASGNYFIGTPHPGTQGIKHHFCTTVEEAAQRALFYDAQGFTVYHACSSFRQEYIEAEVTDPSTGAKTTKRKYRVQENVLAVRSFWLDIDAGEGKDYADQTAAITGLGEFLKASGLPVPMIVSSGNGLHCYWPMDDDLSPEQWRNAAYKLKALTVGLELNADPTRTADHASVLRPVGTHHRKREPKQVALIRDAAPVPFAQFFALIEAACAAHKLDAPKPRSPLTEVERLNEGFAIQRNHAKSDAHKIAERCGQIRQVRDLRGDVSEPHWYGAIQILNCTTQGRDIIHQWSAGYAGYSPDETERKIIQIASMGPTTCAVMEQRNPKLCVGCPHKGKITSPIQLGTVLEKAQAPIVAFDADQPEKTVEVPEPPKPFTRATDGLYIENEDGVQKKFYDYDLYPFALAYDEDLDYEVTYIRHHLPLEGWQDIAIRSSLIERPVECLSALRDKRVKPNVGKYMVSYLDSCMKEIQKKVHLRKMFRALGWKDDGGFVLGKKLYLPDGSIHEADATNKAKPILRAFYSKGDVQQWADATRNLNDPRLAPQAFALLCGFAAPLFKATGLWGAMVSMVGASGGGKSTMGFWAQSIWGNYHDLKVSPRSTYAAMIERFGTYGNLPIFIDEFTNVDPDQISEMAYNITEGKGRMRLRSDSSERPAAEWQTLLMVSTNESLVAKLYLAKDKPEAENLRIFEYEVPAANEMEEFWKHMQRFLLDNHGQAGEVFIRDIVKSERNQMRADIDKIVDDLHTRQKGLGKERFWSNVIGSAIYAGVRAQRLGLVQFELGPIITWALSEVRRMRGDLAHSMSDSVSILAAYLNEHVANRMVIRGNLSGKFNADKLPIGALLHRYEPDTGFVFIERKHLKDYIIKRRMNYNQFRDDLQNANILVDTESKKSLGSGTLAYGSGQVWCWKINMRHPVLAGTALEAA